MQLVIFKVPKIVEERESSLAEIDSHQQQWASSVGVVSPCHVG